MTSADAVGFHHQVDLAGKRDAVECDRTAFFKAHGDCLALDFHVVAPEGDAHDRFDDLHTGVQELKVFCFMGGAEHVGICRIGFFHRHLVIEARLDHEFRHFLATAQFLDELVVEPRLVDAQVRIDQQAVAVETLDIVTLEGTAVTPDINLVFAHGGHQHGAGYCTSERCGVEVSDACRGDVESAALQGGDTFGHQLFAAIDQARQFSTVGFGFFRDGVVVRLVRLAQVGCVGVRNRTFLAHPVQRSAGIEAA